MNLGYTTMPACEKYIVSSLQSSPPPLTQQWKIVLIYMVTLHMHIGLCVYMCI